MNRQEHLLSCLMEECAELAIRCSKALRFGLKEVQAGQSRNNADRIAEEYADVVAVYSILRGDGAVPHVAINAEAKLAKIERFMEIGREQGVLHDASLEDRVAALEKRIAALLTDKSEDI